MSSLIRLLLIALVLAIAWQFRGGLGDIRGALSTAGWWGIGAITLYHIGPMALCGLAWRSLAPDGAAASFVFARWVREGVGEIAGFLPLSGEVAGARVLTRGGVRPAMAGALTVVDVTAEVMAQFFFSLIGLSVWMARHPGAEVVHWALIGLGVSLPVLAAFFLVQRSALVRFLETLPARLMPHVWKAPDTGDGVYAAIAQLYSSRRRIVRAVLIHLSAWLLSTGEAAVALALLGHPLPLADVLALESIIFAIRSGAFVIPAAIGVQEGGYILVGAALGLPMETALAVSLLKRGREVMLGVPALLAWHFAERRRSCQGQDVAS
jgi:putative membrane protein